MQGITMSGITKDFLGKLALQDVDITFKRARYTPSWARTVRESPP